MTCWMMSSDRFMTFTSLLLPFQLLNPVFQLFVLLAQGFDLAGQLFDGLTLVGAIVQTGSGHTFADGHQSTSSDDVSAGSPRSLPTTPGYSNGPRSVEIQNRPAFFVYLQRTSLEITLVPPCLSSGVLMRMSQSTTKIVFVVLERITFSSCMSLRYMSGVA